MFTELINSQHITDVHFAVLLLFSSFFCFFYEMTLTRSRSVVRRAQDPSIRTKKLAHTCWTPWSALKKSVELWARPPVDASAFPSDPQLSFRRRRFQTGQTLEKPAHTFPLLGPCLEILLSKWHTCGTRGSVFQAGVSQQQRWKNL